MQRRSNGAPSPSVWALAVMNSRREGAVDTSHKFVRRWEEVAEPVRGETRGDMNTRTKGKRTRLPGKSWAHTLPFFYTQHILHEGRGTARGGEEGDQTGPTADSNTSSH